MRARLLVCWLALCLLATDCLAARKDFKGLFGSYRRERYTENEGLDSAFGVDILLATALPTNSLVKADAASTAAGDKATLTLGTDMPTSTFFSGELGFWYTLAYHWQIFANIGYYSYDTRIQNPASGGTSQPLFTQFEMKAIPAILGIKYRFGRSDIVPYLGVGAGMSFVTRRGSYDYANSSNSRSDNALTFQGSAGLEFYIASRAGIRLEVSGMYMNLPGLVFDSGAVPSTQPLIKYQQNPLLVRYSSGLFVIF